MSIRLVNSTPVAKLMSNLDLESELADVQFAFSNGDQVEKVPAHRAILASASPVFAAMFYGPLKEGDIVKMTDTSADVFKEFLQFFYLPEVTLSVENIEEIVRLADMYDALSYFPVCAVFLDICLSSEYLGYQSAITTNNVHLMEFCEKHIQMFTDKIIKSVEFLQFSHDAIERILKLDPLQCDEIELYRACIEWAKASCQMNGLDDTNAKNLKNQLGACFYLFRFSTMEDNELSDIFPIKEVDSMFTARELLDIILSKQTKPSKLFNNQPRLKTIYSWDASKKFVGTQDSQHEKFFRIQNNESTWFSSKEFILLGEIRFAYIYSWRTKVACNIDIMEYNTDDVFPTDDKNSKLLYTKKNFEIKSTLTLDNVIVIRPHKIYEIRLRHITDGSGGGSYICTWMTETNLDNKINITFHENPSDKNSTRFGLVSELYFNRLK